MTLVPLGELLSDARARKYAVCAINCCNLENVKCVLEAAAEASAPIIVQAAPSEARHNTVQGLAAAVRAVGRDLNVRAAIHLDHGDSYDLAAQCIRGGFTGVMFDGSALSFEKNIESTKKVAALGRATGVSVRTLQEWEQGRKVPSGAAQSLLKLVSRHPELLAELA